MNESATREAFWRRLDDLVSSHPLVIDRPRGTRHPRYPDFVYPLDYGYLEGTTAVDGNAVDVWIGSLEPRRVTGAAVCVDSHKADVEIKVLLGCTADQIELVGRVHNEKGQSALLVWRD